MITGILHTWSMHPDFLLSLLRLRKRGNILYRFEHDKPFDLGRNMVSKECLDSGAEWCFFLDSDLVLPNDALEKLLRHNLPIVGGLYWRRHPQVFPEMFRFKPGTNSFEPFKQHEIRPGLNKVDGTGAGCLLVHRRVFESLKSVVRERELPVGGKTTKFHEFFRWTIGDTEGDYRQTSEDLYFSAIARRKGFEIYVDASVQCTHILSTIGIKNGAYKWLPLEIGHD